MSEYSIWIFICFFTYWAYCFFWGLRSARRTRSVEDYFLANRSISPWVFAIASTGIAYGGWAFYVYPSLVSRDGLAFANTSFYAVVACIGAMFLLKRQWLLGRKFGYFTSAELLSNYFGGDLIRYINVIIALLFGIPFVAMLMGASGSLVSHLTDDVVSRTTAMWYLTAIVLLYSVMGGLQAVMKVAVVQTVLLCIGLLILGSLALDHVGGFDLLNQGLANLINTEHSYLGMTSGMGGGNFDGYLALPGVIQWTSGIGFEVPIGGPWTAIMGLTFLLSVIGIQTSPAFTMLVFSSRSVRGFALHQTWGSACVIGFLLLFFGTIIGLSGHLSEATKNLHHSQTMTELIIQTTSQMPWLAGLLAVCLVAALQATGAGFLFTTGNILSRDIYLAKLNPEATDKQQMKVARIATLVVFLAAMLLASWSMEAVLVFSSLALAASLQLWPALLAATWMPRWNKQAVISGLVLGLIAVVLTEPLGQKLAVGSLPWGAWPWTIHSGAWGLFFNLGTCLLVSLVNSEDSQKDHRQKFHDYLISQDAPLGKDRWAKPLAGVFIIVWLFFAVGPGSVLGNFAFGAPDAGFENWIFGMPSLWAWQVIWWALGVSVIWFLANKLRLSAHPEVSTPNAIELTKFS